MHSHSQQLTTSVFTIISIISFKILWSSNLLFCFSKFEIILRISKIAFVLADKLFLQFLYFNEISMIVLKFEILKISFWRKAKVHTIIVQCPRLSIHSLTSNTAIAAKCSALWSAKIYIARSEEKRRKKKKLLRMKEIKIQCHELALSTSERFICRFTLTSSAQLQRDSFLLDL